MIKAIIVDDEKGARESLAKMVSKYCPDIEIMDKCDSMISAFDAIKQFQPDLVFLDIEMPNGNAFDLLEKFTEINFDIIFTTAYDHYAIKAIKFSAIDYLLKPIDPEELVLATEQFKKKQEKKEILNIKFQTLLTNIQSNNKLKRVGIPEQSGLTFINIQDILYCESENSYTVFVLAGNNKLISTHTLLDYEQLFSDENFFRIHRSFLINLNYVKKYIKGNGGFVIMDNDVQLEVSRSAKDPLLERLSKT